eukprot:CAMPEP_0170199968 /NCGR_PEP_ID=MMETSP0040_2-20121228/69625_1 /TAXON_ID=641309 /ORGANISM="Lotharella oceanica, Strain CCMP622" /LENGTH=331 /DNA_ID=CAMNT_0010450129 /DNA_START=62 /DNA_END=1057 /DNA_ORIENTATION=-
MAFRRDEMAAAFDASNADVTRAAQALFALHYRKPKAINLKDDSRKSRKEQSALFDGFRNTPRSKYESSFPKAKASLPKAKSLSRVSFKKQKPIRFKLESKLVAALLRTSKTQPHFPGMDNSANSKLWRKRNASAVVQSSRKKIVSQRNPTSKEQCKLIDDVQQMMNILKLNQSEISKIVNVPQPYISMFLNRRWRGSFDSPTWIRLVDAVSKWLKKQQQQSKYPTSKKEPPTVKKEQPTKRKEQPIVKKEQQSPSNSPKRKDPTVSQTKSPERKPDRYDLPPPLRSSLLPSFIQSGGDTLRPFNWRCSVCTYMNQGASIECKICGKLKRRH